MHAVYLSADTVRITLANGEALGETNGPVTLDVTTHPGLTMWDAFLATGAAIAPAVPSSITKLGLKRALAEAGEWTEVRALIASDPDRQEEWDLATEIRRADPLVAGMIAVRGYTPGQVDVLMIRAAELVA